MSNYKFVDIYYSQGQDTEKFIRYNDKTEMFIRYNYLDCTVTVFIDKEKYSYETYLHSLDHLVDALNPTQEELDYIEVTEGKLCVELYLKALEIYRSKTDG